MNFIKTPMKGMQEQLPIDMEVREYALNKIKQSYLHNFFLRKNKNPQSIATPQTKETTADFVNPAIMYVTNEIAATQRA